MEQVLIFLSSIFGVFIILYHSHRASHYRLQFCSPLYDWKAMEADGFSWWIKRIKRALDLYDEFRIDHFRGLAGFWAVPSGKQNTWGHCIPAYICTVNESVLCEHGFPLANLVLLHSVDAKVALVGSWRVSIELKNMVLHFSFSAKSSMLICFPCFLWQ